MDCVVGGGDLKKTERTFHVRVPGTISSSQFSIEAVSVTGFFCSMILSLDTTETRATRFCPKEVPPNKQKRSIRKQVFVTFMYVEHTILTFILLCSVKQCGVIVALLYRKLSYYEELQFGCHLFINSLSLFRRTFSC